MDARPCRHCGKEFRPSHESRKFCSHECRREALRAYQREYQAALRKDPGIREQHAKAERDRRARLREATQ